jgi:hypothetical protein
MRLHHNSRAFVPRLSPITSCGDFDFEICNKEKNIYKTWKDTKS